MATTALDTAFAALTAAVAAERESTGVLAYRLTTVRLLLDGGEPQLLSEGLAELELAAAGREAAGRRRQQARGDLMGPLGIDPSKADLGCFAATAPEQWSQPLDDHRIALQELVERLGRDTAAVRDRSQRALADVRRRLGPGGRRRHLEALPSEQQRRLLADLDLESLVTELRIREVTYEGVTEVTAELLPDDLVRFVGLPVARSLTSSGE